MEKGSSMPNYTRMATGLIFGSSVLSVIFLKVLLLSFKQVDGLVHLGFVFVYVFERTKRIKLFYSVLVAPYILWSVM